jgi:hypothetical protein
MGERNSNHKNNEELDIDNEGNNSWEGSIEEIIDYSGQEEVEEEVINDKTFLDIVIDLTESGIGRINYSAIELISISSDESEEDEEIEDIIEINDNNNNNNNNNNYNTQSDNIQSLNIDLRKENDNDLSMCDI